jgi:hypothetical protein
MSLDLVLRQCRIAGREDAIVDIGLKDGLVSVIGPGLPNSVPAAPAEMFAEKAAPQAARTRSSTRT